MATQPIFSDVPAWPTPSAGAPAPRGHNKPPPEEVIPAEFREALLADKPHFLDRLNDLVDAADHAKAEDDDTLGRCGDLVKAYRDSASHINATHKAVKEPYLVGGRLVDAERNALLERLDAAKKKVEAIGNAYVAKRDAALKAERERIAAEQRAAAERAAAAERERERAELEAICAASAAPDEAERIAAEERAEQAARAAEDAMAAAALVPAAPSRDEPVRSDAGATVSGKQEWKAEVVDYDVAYVTVADDEKVREAIDKAIARRVKAGARKIEGVRIWPVAKANFR